MKTVRELLESLKRYGKKVALRMPRDESFESFLEYTYEEVVTYSKAISRYLSSLLNKGEKVALLSENRPEWGIIALGVGYNGHVLVPVDFRANEYEIRFVLEHSESKILFASKKLLKVLEDSPVLKRFKEVLCIEEDFERIVKENVGKEFKLNPLKGEDVFEIVYTSGTTGNPKGVMLTHKNITFEVLSITKTAKVFNPNERFLSILPINHSYESTAGLYTPLYNGCEVVYSPSMVPRVVIDLARKVKPTRMLVVPLFLEKIYDGIIRRVNSQGLFKKVTFKLLYNLSRAFKLGKIIFKPLRDKTGFGTVRTFVSGASPLPKRVLEGMETLGFSIIQGYGLTEAGPVVSFNPLDRPKNESVGKPIEGVEVKVVDRDERGIGEVVVKGENVMKGYFKDEEATKKVLKEGYLYTGDLGYFDEEGYLYITGRKKNVIVTKGGKNVYPEELEELLMESPFIFECAVVGRKEGGGEYPFAYIVPDFDYFEFYFSKNPDFEEVLKVIKEEVDKVNRRLRPFQRIRDFKVLKEELPKTSTRKVKRYLLS